MSGVEMKSSGQPHAYPPTDPPPYSPPQPPLPSMVVSGPTTVIHPGTTTVIHGPRPAIVLVNPMSPNPSAFICRSCNQQIVTRVEYKPSTRTHLFALLLCVVGCWPLVCLPYCMDTCNNANHYCPNCNAYLGAYTS